MNPDSPFSKSFFNFFNDPEPDDLLKKDQEELTRLINTVLYEQIGGQAKYYTQSSNLLSQLEEDENYRLIKAQLEAIKNKLKNFSLLQQGVGSEVIFEQFFDRLLNPASDHITLFYKEQGKRILEEISILLFDNKIDFNQRIKIMNEFFASDGLTQCIDNCYFLILDVNKKLKSLKRANYHIYYLIRNYVTSLASEVATSRPFGFSKTYVEIACELTNLPVFSHEIHARNFFLLYAKENNFPVNVLPDAIAENLRGRLLDFDLQHAYLQDFKDRFTISGIIDYLSKSYSRDIEAVIEDSQKSYQEKQNFIQKKLDLLGIDDQFYWHEIFCLKEDNFVLKSPEHLKITIIDRLTRNQWLRYWVDLHVVTVKGKPYNFFYYKENIMVSWLSFEDESDKSLKRILFLDLFKPDNIAGLSQDHKKILCFELINKRKFITNAKELDFILNKYPLVESYILKDQFVELIRKNDDIKIFSSLINVLSKETGIFVLEELSDPFVRRMLAHAFLYANIETRIKELPKNNLYTLSPPAIQEICTLTNHLLRNLIDRGVREFESFYFPLFKSVDYLDNIDFSYCNMKKAFFAQSLSHCDFNHAYLDEAKFLMKLKDISFSQVNLKTTEFLGGNYFHFEEIVLYKATLSTQSFKLLLKANVFDFSYANLVDVNMQDILKEKIRLDFSFADLEGVDLSNLNLKKVNLFYANLKKTNLLGASLRKKNINEHILIQGASIDWNTIKLFYSIGIRNFYQSKIISNIELADPFSSVIKIKEASFKEAEFFGSHSTLNFIKCDFSHAIFQPGSGQKYSFLVDVLYEQCKFQHAKFISITFFPVKFVQCEISSLNLIDVRLSTELLFALYEHGHRDFKEVKFLSGRLPQKIMPFPFSGASLSEEVFVALYKEGLRDFRSSNLYHFNLRGTLTREGISEPDLKLESALYKRSLLVCAQKRSERSVTSVFKKCIVHFLIKVIYSKENIITTNNLFSLAKDLKDKKRSVMFNHVVKEISLEFSPLESMKEVYKINFYWNSLQVDKKDLIKIIHFLNKSTEDKDRRKTRLIFHLSRRFILNADTTLFYQDLTDLGFRKIFINYIQVDPVKGLVYFRKKDIRLNENFNKRKINSKNIMTTPQLIPHPDQASSAYPVRNNALYRFNKNLQRFTHAMRVGARKGHQYQIGLALMNLIAAAIITASTRRKVILPQQKQELIAYAQVVAKQQAQERGASKREYFLALSIAKQCIERGECHNKETIALDIKDTLLRVRPHAAVGSLSVWQSLKRFFSGIGYYLNYRYARLKKVFLTKDEDRIHLERRQENLLSRWSPQVLPYNTFINDESSLEIADYTEEEEELDHEEIDGQDLQFLENSTVVDQEGILFYMQCIPNHYDLVKYRMYNWYDYPLLSDLIKKIERAFAILDFNLENYFNEADLAGLLYNLWLALDQQGVTDQTDPEFILSLFHNEDFIKAVFPSDSPLSASSNFNQSDDALDTMEIMQRRKRSISVVEKDKLFLTTQRFFNKILDKESIKLTTNVSTEANSTCFFSNQNVSSEERVNEPNQAVSRFHPRTANTVVALQKVPFSLQRLNENLFFLNYLIHCFRYYFLADKSKKAENNPGLFSFNRSRHRNRNQSHAQNDRIYLETVEDSIESTALRRIN